MKALRTILLIFFLVVGLLLLGGYFLLRSTSPNYEGSLQLEGLDKKVEVFYDDYGIPHIYADTEKDAQFALGFVHAQDRLFQMEMIRRVGRGDLAEILGPDMAKTDRFFRTIGTLESARRAAKVFHAKADDDPMKIAAQAYLDGINAFIDQDNLPVEYQLMGIPVRHFTIEDTYATFAYMAFSFAQAFRTDPLVMRIKEKYGDAYLADLDVHWNPAAQVIPHYKAAEMEEEMAEAFGIKELFESMPVAPWIGSNSWVIGPSKTKNGKVLFSNDTHIAYAQPSVWYEAHIEFPGLKSYGSYLAGVPFPVIGHNEHHAIGLTMFENDDIDFYVEKINPENANQVYVNDHWEEMESREERVKVLDEEDLVFTVQTTRHGPLVNDAIEDISKTTEDPISFWWVYNEFIPNNLELAYGMSHKKTLEEVRACIATGAAPGLNVMYGDVDGNIAWWAMAKLPKRPEHTNSKFFLDGASGEDEIDGYYEFEDNPQSENPPSGFVYSANNQPTTHNGVMHPGYYIPQARAKRIVDILSTDKKWDMEAAQEMITDVKSPIMPKVAQAVLAQLSEDKTELEAQAATVLGEWDGDNQLDDIAPTIYTKLLFHIAEKTFADELGEEDFNTFLLTHMIKRTLPFLAQNDTSVWWDKKDTEALESRQDIFQEAYSQTIQELETQLGGDINEWKWGKVNSIEHPHPLAQVEALRGTFNVGPMPIKGATEVINNQMSIPNAEGMYEVKAGPALRRIIDFGDMEHSVSVLPSGQSGNFMSPHYGDQAEMFAKGEFRLQMTNKDEIKKIGKKLVLKP